MLGIRKIVHNQWRGNSWKSNASIITTSWRLNEIEFQKQSRHLQTISSKQEYNNGDNNYGTKQNQQRNTHKILKGVLYGTIGVGVVLGLATTGIALNSESTTQYPFWRRWMVAADSIFRFCRSAVTCAIIAADYKWIWFRFPEDHPRYKEETSKLHLRSAQRMLRLCEKNGGVYVKGGQYIASLNHFLPREWITTMSVLQDRAPRITYEEVQKVFLEDFNHPIEYYFDHFEESPRAAASLAQVHYAITKDGREVAVKIQYPTIQDRFHGDMWSHDFFLAAIEVLFKGWEFSWMGPEIRENLSKELDFVNEARNAARASEDLSSLKNVYVPKTIPELTTKRVLTMEYIHGVKITDLEQLKKMNVSIAEVARTMIDIFSTQIFIAGFVHCDPHPGNIFVRVVDGKTQLVLLDHGLYRQVSDEFRYYYCRLWKALVLRDEKDLAKFSFKLGVEDYDIFAIIILMRSFKGANVGLSSKMSMEDIKKFIESMQQNMMQYVKVMQQMPRELLLVLRNNNLVRSINKELGTPVNRFAIMARTAVRGIQLKKAEKVKDLRGFRYLQYRWNTWKETIIFDSHLAFYSFLYWLSDVYIILLRKTGRIPDIDFEELALKMEAAS